MALGENGPMPSTVRPELAAPERVGERPRGEWLPRAPGLAWGLSSEHLQLRLRGKGPTALAKASGAQPLARHERGLLGKARRRGGVVWMLGGGWRRGAGKGGRGRVAAAGERRAEGGQTQRGRAGKGDLRGRGATVGTRQMSWRSSAGQPSPDARRCDAPKPVSAASGAPRGLAAAEGSAANRQRPARASGASGAMSTQADGRRGGGGRGRV